MSISAIILTKNEEKNIERAIKSVKFCDQIIVVDDYSSDNTVKKARELGAKTFQRRLNNNFSAQRNFAMEKAKGEWLLFVDADEEVTRELRGEISRVILSEVPLSGTSRRIPLQSNLKMYGDSSVSRRNVGIPRNDAWRIKRRDFWWGRELRYGEVRKISQFGLIRLVRKGSGYWAGKVHEEYKVKNEKLKIESLENYLNHYPHPKVKDFLEEINFYSTLRAKELFDQRKKTNILEIVLYPLGKFLLTYFIKLGFLDGPAGFAYAFFMSFHSFLVRAKLFQYNMKHET